MEALRGCGKTLRSPFDTIRGNGAGVENIDGFPFMLSQSKHEKLFFSTLLSRQLANERGIVLVIALLIIALLLGGGIGAIVSMQTDLKSSSNLRAGTQAFYFADAGINHARQELQDADGTNDFDQVFGGSPTDIVSNTSFYGGTYTVTLVQSSGSVTSPPRQIKVLSSGNAPNNAKTEVEAWFKRVPGRPPKAIETGEDLKIENNVKILGTCGGAHTNDDLTVKNNPAIQMANGLTSSDRMDIDDSPCVGSAACANTPPPDAYVLDTSAERSDYESANKNQPTYSIPAITAADYASKVAGMASAGNHYILNNDGTVTTGGTCGGTDGLCLGGDPVSPPPTGWSFSGDKWRVTGSSAANGVFYSETPVEIESPGSEASPWQATIISRGDITVKEDSSPNIRPYPSGSEELQNLLFVTGGNLKIEHGNNMRADHAGGAILVQDKFEIDGNAKINGFIIARNQTSEQENKIKGNAQISYNCDFGCSGPGCPPPSIATVSWAQKF